MVAKAVPADTGLKLLAAMMRNMGRMRGCLEMIMLDVFLQLISKAKIMVVSTELF